MRELAEERVRPQANHVVRKALGAVAVAAVFAGAMYARLHHAQTAAADTAGPRLDAYGAVDNPDRQLCELP